MDLLVYRTSSRTALHLQRAAMVSETRCTAKSAMTVIRLMAMAAPRAANVKVVFPMGTVLALTYQKAMTPPRLGHPPKRPKHKVKWSNYLLVTANTDEMKLLYAKQPSQIIQYHTQPLAQSSPHPFLFIPYLILPQRSPAASNSASDPSSTHTSQQEQKELVCYHPLVLIYRVFLSFRYARLSRTIQDHRTHPSGL